MLKMSQKMIYNLIFDDVLEKIKKKLNDKQTIEKLNKFNRIFQTQNIKDYEKICYDELPDFYNIFLLIVNSNIISPKSKINDFSSAVVILGKNTVFDITRLYIILNDIIEYYHYYLKMQMFHNLTVAVIAHNSASVLLKKDDDNYEMFLCGFLHNFGKILILSFEKGVYFNIFDEANVEGLSYGKVEEIIYGDQFQIRLAFQILTFLGFTDRIIDITTGYVKIKKSQNQLETSALHLCDIIATGLFIGISGDNKIPILQKELLGFIKITPTLLDALYVSSLDKLLDIPAFYEKIVSSKNR